MVGLFIFLLVNTVFSSDLQPFPIAAEVVLAIDAYFLYRVAKSLAPLSKVPLEPGHL